MTSLHPVLLVLFMSLCLSVVASPLIPTPTHQIQGRFERPSLVRRTDPTFPPSPPSCQICAKSYPSINSCAIAAPAFANFSQIIYAPGEFIDLIKCACTDTFQSAFPQCADCFQQTNQTALIDPSNANLPSIISGMRSICTLESTLLGNVTGHNGEQVNGTPIAVPMAARAVGTKPAAYFVLLSNISMFLAIAIVTSAMLWQ